LSTSSSISNDRGNDNQGDGSRFANEVSKHLHTLCFFKVWYAATMESQLITKIRESAHVCHTQAAAILDDRNEISDEGIHTLRVQTKRLRAYWELLNPLVGKSQVKSATKELRSASSSFGAARDHHVMVKLLGKLVAKASKPKLQASLTDALKAIVDSHATSVPASTSGSATSHDEVAQAWKQDRQRWNGLRVDAETDSQGNRCVRRGLQRIFKKARKLHARAVAEHEIERWHELRKWVKYLSLTVPLCGDDPATTIAAEEWARLGKSLGKLHDYDELIKRIGQLTPTQIDDRRSDRAIQWLTDKRDRLCVRCDMHARRLLAQRPGPFGKTLIPG